MPPRVSYQSISVEEEPKDEQEEHHEKLHVPLAFYAEEVTAVSSVALPTLSGMILNKIPWLISLRFVGGIGAPELAAAALATTVFNVTGLSLSVGLSSALSTLTGQSRGDLLHRYSQRRHDTNNESSTEPLMPLVYLYRGMAVQCLLILPIGLIWLCGTQSILMHLGQGPEVAAMTNDYLRILTVGLWAYSISWTITAWLQAIEMADVPGYTAVVGLVLHVPFNYLFIYTLGLGYLGAAVATVAFQLLQPLLMCVYLLGTSSGRRRVLTATGATTLGKDRLSFLPEAWLAVTSLKGILQYLGLALPGIVSISEWWASETAVFWAGQLAGQPELALGAMTLYQSINSTCFMFPVSASIACATRVAHWLGAGKPAEARAASRLALGLAGILSTILGTILFVTPHTFFPSLFAPKEYELIHLTARTLPFLTVYVIADGLQTALNGVIKGTGQQVLAMPIVLVAYWFVGLPLAYYLAFTRHDGSMACGDNEFCGVLGLVAGMTTGTCLHMLLLATVVLGTTDWPKQALLAQARVGATESKHAPSEVC